MYNLKNQSGAVYLVGALFLSMLMLLLVSGMTRLLYTQSTEQAKSRNMAESLIYVESLIHQLRSARGTYELYQIGGSSIICQIRSIETFNFCMDSVCLDSDSNRWCLNLSDSQIISSGLNPKPDNNMYVYNKKNENIFFISFNFPSKAEANFNFQSLPDPGSIIQNAVSDFVGSNDIPDLVCGSPGSSPDTYTICLRVRICPIGTDCNNPFIQDVRFMEISMTP